MSCRGGGGGGAGTGGQPNSPSPLNLRFLETLAIIRKATPNFHVKREVRGYSGFVVVR